MGVFLRRLVGAAMLDRGIFEDVESDATAMAQSVAVVVLSSLAAGIGATGLYDTPSTLRFFAVASVIALIAWVGWALITLQIGARILPAKGTRVDLGQLLRTLGFAAAPGLILIFAVLPGMVTPVFVIAFFWTLAATVVAVRQALDYTSTLRALAVCALGWGLTLAFVFGIGLFFGSTVQ